jgi:hypothetical protein
MVKVEVINKEFTLTRFDELKNIERKSVDTYGKLYVGDKFECSQELCDYLQGNNKLKQAFVKVIEVIPEEVEDVQVADTPKPVKSKKKKK